MPKVKTQKSAIRRFKLTKRGKVTHRAAFNRHLKRKKTASRLRRLNSTAKVRGKLRKKLISVLSR